MIDDLFAERIPANLLMKSLLDDVGFDFDRPEPILAWIAFQRFVVEPSVGLSTDNLGWECVHSERDDRLWLSFMRSIEVGGVGCHLSVELPSDLRDARDNYWHWEEHESLAEWIAIVEASSVFWRCLAVAGWRWEGFAV